jgi:hypothetical protein
VKQHLNNVIHQITSDKKKLGVMLCALAIGLLLWGRLLLQGVPRTATADDPAVSAMDPHNSPVETYSAAQPAKPMPVVHVDLPSKPGRDLFGMDPSRYRRTPGSGPGTRGAKSTQVTPDEDPQIAVVREEAIELRLESVLTGTQPRAYINGYLLAPGDEYEGFTLIKVTDRHVLLTKYGLIIRLRM